MSACCIWYLSLQHTEQLIFELKALALQFFVMLIGNVDSGTLGSMDFAIDTVVIVEQPGKMSITDLELVDTLPVLRQLVNKFV